ncbi:hypothetical protein PHYPSEUDO_000030 [Phytophthora pseudosyringae]|uniref:Uncharacterized protein n=1 Tax=Phytophthora pseudosyringae TaxID=221518 RepID=A0A8T1WPG8_9STRA|nr:hypothetical protein PHYPSEUDO_000030 [Phytophthora pseudosyringae]
MRGAGAADSRVARPLSSRRPSGRFPVHGEATHEFRAATPKPGTNRSSALQSTGHLLVHDDLMAAEPNEPRDGSLRATTPLTSRPSHSRLSGCFQVQDTGILTGKDEFPLMTARVNNPPSLAKQYSARLQPQDIEVPANSKQESPTRNTSGSSRPPSAAKLSGRLQVHGDASTQEIQAVSPCRSRPSSPVQEINDNLRVHNSDIPATKPEMPTRIVPLSPIRQLSARIKLHDDGALANNSPKGAIPILPSRQPSGRLQVHGDGAITSKEFGSMASEAIDTRGTKDQGVKHDHQHHEAHQSESNHAHAPDIPDIPSSSATEPTSRSPASRFVPLHSQWTYGQRVFGRYKKTPCFYSGNIATYLGGGMFMVVFDDGTLDYRVRREDIMLREHPSASSSSNQQTKKRRDSSHRQNQDGSSKGEDGESLRLDGFSGLEADDAAKASANAEARKTSPQKQGEEGEESEDYWPDPSVAPEMHLLSLQHVMVDFSVTPPREMVLSFDDYGTTYEIGGPPCGVGSTDNETWRHLVEDETLTMKRLECGVGYEDDSTQVSDSDESSEEDMSMTPWQQMTQTFGMGKATRAQRGTGRRSSISSIDRLSITQKAMNQIIPTPRSLKQIITEYFMRGNKKVQPSKLTDELVLGEHVRLMEAKLNSMRSTRCTSGSPTAAPLPRRDSGSLRVIYERAPDGVRAYGTVTNRVDDEGYAVVTEDEHSISVQVVPKDKVDFLPSVCELEQQLTDLEKSQRLLFAGQKVNVSLYPGSRFCGRGMITEEREYQSRFHVLLANRIRLVNVPANKISPLHEKKKAAVTITEDQFLVCSNKVKVYIGDQIYVKFSDGNGDLDSSSEEEKLGLLNGVYSNRTAAVDFADGSTGYEVPPHLIFKRRRVRVPADQDVRSLKNAVLMQASVAANGGAKRNLPVLEEGYQVKADHPSKVAVESCIVIKVHPSSACDLRFSDGTIAFEVFPSQMVIDSVEHQRMQTKATTSLITNDSYNRSRQVPTYAVDACVLAWSSRFGRYCSAKIISKISQDPTGAPGFLVSPSVRSLSGVDTLASPTVHSVTMPVTTSVPTSLYTLVFDYGEQKAQMPADKITCLDDTTALSHTQRLTNYSIDTMGFELSPVTFIVGEAVMARVHGSARYFNGIVEAVNEKERVCAVCFDSSERDTTVLFSGMFSVDSRSRFTGRGSSTNKQVGSGGSSSSETASRARFISRNRITEDVTPASEVITHPRRHSSGSVGNMLRSMDSYFRGTRSKPGLDPRRGSHMATEIGAHVHMPER